MHTKKLLIGFIALVSWAQTTSKNVLVTWQDLLNPAGTLYNLYKAPTGCSGAPTFTKIASNLTAKTYTDQNVPPGTYCYMATAVLTGGNESWASNYSEVKVPGPAPTGLLATPQ